MALKENYKDDILDTSQNVKRKYRMTDNGDGTVSFDDETEYLQEGDNFGSGAINPIAHAINGLNNYNFHPSGSIDLVAYIADDSYYLNEDNKYVLADSPTGQALITSEPSTYKALASNTDLYGIEGEDTVSGFEPSSTPITVEGQTLSTIDDKLNFIVQKEANPNYEYLYSFVYVQSNGGICEKSSIRTSGFEYQINVENESYDDVLIWRNTHSSYVSHITSKVKAKVKYYIVLTQDGGNIYTGEKIVEANEDIVRTTGNGKRMFGFVLIAPLS